jgi:hypothetical protein
MISPPRDDGSFTTIDRDATSATDNDGAFVDHVRDQLQTLYRELDVALVQAAPVCALSGRCCRFREYGHTLFLSRPEADLLIADAPPPARELDSGETCPWQDAGGRCTARSARPLGCRVYFCEPSFEALAPALSERFIARLKQLARDHEWTWDYAPLHDHLHRARAEGRLEIDLAAGFPDR